MKIYTRLSNTVVDIMRVFFSRNVQGHTGPRGPAGNPGTEGGPVSPFRSACYSVVEVLLHTNTNTVYLALI